jgi:hypothetical protein
VLLDLGDDVKRLAAFLRRRRDVQRVVDRGQVSGLELDVDDRPDDLDNAADLLFGCGCGCHKLERLCA